MENKLINMVKDFETLQWQLKDFGAADSEPNYVFKTLMRKAVKGETWPQKIDWDLYTSVKGVEDAEKQLTEAAKSIFDTVATSPHYEVMKMAAYYGY